MNLPKKYNLRKRECIIKDHREELEASSHLQELTENEHVHSLVSPPSPFLCRPGPCLSELGLLTSINIIQEILDTDLQPNLFLENLSSCLISQEVLDDIKLKFKADDGNKFLTFSRRVQNSLYSKDK